MTDRQREGWQQIVRSPRIVHKRCQPSFCGKAELSKILNFVPKITCETGYTWKANVEVRD
jgi:hypothetical protein